MVTLKELQAQKKKLMEIRAKVQAENKLELEKVGLQREIKVLKRSPGTSRNIILAKRIGRGLRIGSKKIGQAGLRQAKRIKEQQARDRAAIGRAGKVGKKRMKKIKTGQRLSKIKEGNRFDVFSNLDF